MRRSTAVLLTTALAAAGSLGFSNHDDDFEYEPDFVLQEAFFHGASTPVGNLDSTALDEHVTWDENAPTAPFSSIYAMDNLGGTFVVGDHNSTSFFTATGTFTGDLDTLAVDLYIEQPAMAVCDMSLSFELTIDGTTILSQEATGSQGVDVEPVEDTRGIARFELTNIFAAMEEFEEFGYDIEPHGGPDVEREVTLNLQNFYLCNEAVVLYDSADTPSSITANAYSFFHPDFDVTNMPPPIG